MAGESLMTTKPISIESTSGKPGETRTSPMTRVLSGRLLRNTFGEPADSPLSAARATIRSVISAEILSFQRVVSYFPKITVLGKCEAAAI